LASMSDLNVWDLATLPPGARTVGCKWVFKHKRDATGKVVK
jgi:hypothetical protein